MNRFPSRGGQGHGSTLRVVPSLRTVEQASGGSIQQPGLVVAAVPELQLLERKLLVSNPRVVNVASITI